MKPVKWSLIPLFLALCACSLFKRGEPEEGDKQNKPVEGPELVGRVASIAVDRRFVLIQSYGPWKNTAGTILTTRGGDDRVANLLVTGEALGQFAAADIQSGAVETGDAVYSVHLPKPPEPASGPVSEAETTENQKDEKSENVQKNN